MGSSAESRFDTSDRLFCCETNGQQRENRLEASKQSIGHHEQILALVDGVAVELLAEVFLTSAAWHVVLPGRERLVATVAGILVCVFENLAAVLLRVRLCPFCAGLDVAQPFLKVPDDRSVVVFLLDSSRGSCGRRQRASSG